MLDVKLWKAMNLESCRTHFIRSFTAQTCVFIRLEYYSGFFLPFGDEPVLVFLQ